MWTFSFILLILFGFIAASEENVLTLQMKMIIITYEANEIDFE